jgi:hypothetical protein
MFIFNTVAAGEAAGANRAEDHVDIANEEEEQTKDHPAATAEEDAGTNAAAAIGDAQTKAHPPCHLPGLLIELSKEGAKEKNMAATHHRHTNDNETLQKPSYSPNNLGN